MKKEYEISAERNFTYGLSELWSAREMCVFFAWRDLKVRYKQTILGVLWVVIQPLMMMLAFYFLVGRTSSQFNAVNYLPYAFVGLCLYYFFSGGFSNAANSMVTNSAIIRKVYFPRLIIPVSSVLVSFIDLLCTTPFIIAILVWKQVNIHWEMTPYILPGLLILMLTTAGAGIFLSALNIKYRDVRYVIPFISQFLLFTTPAVYPESLLQKEWVRQLFAFNPLTSAMEFFRAFITGNLPDAMTICIGGGMSLLLFFGGLYYFKRTENYFADII